MESQNQTKPISTIEQQSADELTKLRQRIAELETLVAERQRTEKTLRKSEKQFRQLAESVQDALWLGTLGTGKDRKILYISPAFEKIFGIESKEIYKSDQAWVEILHEQDRERVLNLLEDFLQNYSGYDVEYRIVHPDGSLRWVWAKGFVIRDEAGEVYRTAGLAQDITKRK